MSYNKAATQVEDGCLAGILVAQTFALGSVPTGDHTAQLYTKCGLYELSVSQEIVSKHAIRHSQLRGAHY